MHLNKSLLTSVRVLRSCGASWTTYFVRIPRLRLGKAPAAVRGFFHKLSDQLTGRNKLVMHFGIVKQQQITLIFSQVLPLVDIEFHTDQTTGWYIFDNFTRKIIR